MLKFRPLTLALAFAVAPLWGCPKKPTQPEGPVVVNPRQAFLNGVLLLKGENKTGEIDYAAAYGAFTSATDVKPDYTKAHYNAGWTAERMGNLSTAETHYRAALELDGSSSDTLFALGGVLSELGKGVEAVELYRGFLASSPDDLKVRNLLMEGLIGAKMYDEAIAEAREILLRDPKNVGAYRNLSRVYFSQDKFPMSQLCAEKAKTLAEGDAGIYNNIGVTYLVVNNEPAAINEFTTAVKLDPDNVQANLNLGYVALNSGDYVLARTSFENALKGSPGDIDAKLGLAVALRGAREYPAAAKLYDEILSVDPSNEIAYFNSATLQEKYIKDYKKALKLLETYVNENNSDGHIGPGHEVYARMERVKESQRIEDEHKAEEARQKKAAEERKKRQRAKFDELKSKVGSLQSLLDKYGTCEMMVEMGGTEMGMMVLEQAQMVVEAEEIDMAADVMTFIDEIMPQIEMIVPECTGAAPAAGGDAPAPEGSGEGAEAAPSEDAPATPEAGTVTPAE